MERSSDYGAFMEKFVLKPSSSSHELPLNGLTFAVKDIFDVNGFVTGFGNPDWARTHSAATSTAPAVLAILRGGATCVGKTVMDEMAYSLDGDNKHYGTPTNPCAPDRVPGGSSSGSAVAVGWFARDPVILNRVGRILLQLPDVDLVRPRQIFIAEDCFQLSSIPNNRVSQVLVKSVEKLFGRRYEFKNNHGEWVTTVKPDLGPGISERVWEAIQTTGESIDICYSVKAEIIATLTTLLEVSIPLGMYNDVPVAISLLAKHGSDGFLLNVVETLYDTLQEQIAISE
ncbi:hypothetical protein GH714_022110 [Hevea brasiliensis]|uniref:Amidase domain-containing protein n=1 Tax=Hevea brasiliensis TaxID=3981 RepID=A0A6A6LFA4_HEVBR|nr:hypothetical protein GH714_022110 [Hevea brasiliensis]